MKHLEQAEKNNKANKLYAIEIKECPDVIVQGTPKLILVVITKQIQNPTCY